MRDLLGQEIKKGDLIAYVDRTSQIALCKVTSFSKEEGTVRVPHGQHGSDNKAYGSRCVVVTKLTPYKGKPSNLCDLLGYPLEVGDWVIGTRPYSTSILVGKIASCRGSGMGFSDYLEVKVMGSAIMWIAATNSLVRVTELPALVQWLLFR